MQSWARAAVGSRPDKRSTHGGIVATLGAELNADELQTRGTRHFSEDKCGQRGPQQPSEWLTCVTTDGGRFRSAAMWRMLSSTVLPWPRPSTFTITRSILYRYDGSVKHRTKSSQRKVVPPCWL